MDMEEYGSCRVGVVSSSYSQMYLCDNTGYPRHGVKTSALYLVISQNIGCLEILTRCSC